MGDVEPPKWHALNPDEVLEALEAGVGGLGRDEAARRLEIHGPNRLPSGPGRPAWKRLLAQFHNVLIYVLIAAAAMAAMLDHMIDAAVIAAVVLVNALIGFVQEGRAERAMEAIGRMLAPKARARRDGHFHTIPAEELVPGDIVKLRSGDRVPAEIRLIEAHGLRVDQAALTGESVPVSKTPTRVDENTDLADRRCIAYSGSMVSGGEAIGVVAVTGRNTELGRISAMLEEVKTLTTPLLKQINHFAWILTLVILALTAAVIAWGALFHAIPWTDGFLAGVALVVAAIPEGLPAIITITLAVGIQRMAGRNAVIRRLPAVETLGAVTVICSDKTGTLTRNELVGQKLTLADGEYALEDSGRPDGDSVGALLSAAALCNDAEPGAGEGDPLEVALVRAAEQAGLDVAALRRMHPRTGLLPFSSDLKFMATVHGDRVCLKGAPEMVIAKCARQLEAGGPGKLDAEYWQRQLERLAEEGLRLLAIAEGRIARDLAGELRPDAIPEDLCLLGLVAFADPLRNRVPEAIEACRRAGIRVKMITGDHAATARAIAARLGFCDDGEVLTGAELNDIDDDRLKDRVTDVNVYARTTPEHKLRLVRALQAQGEVVAMTGDGANDAPALKRADIGVAMGIKGTEASRQAAEMVLSDDNFATIVAGIEEGRGVYDNIRKALMFILPTNGAESLVIILAVLAGLALPLTPVQILWINMATAVTLALALAFEPLESDAMHRPPREPRERIISPFMLWRIVWVSAVLTVAVFSLFSWALDNGADEAIARTVALNALVAGEVVYLFNCRRWLSPSWTPEALLANPWAWVSVGVLAVLQAGLTYLPQARIVFGTAPLAPAHWLAIAGIGLAVFVLVEIEKRLIGRFAPTLKPAGTDPEPVSAAD